MKKTLTIKAKTRDLLGRKVKRLRKEGVLPANVYGKSVKSQAVQVLLNDFEKVYKQAGETGLVDLELGKTKKTVLIHNLQIDPVTAVPLHADFFQVDLKQKVTAQVPVEVLGESPAEKQGLGTLVTLLDEIEVEALPADLPEKFELDLTSLTEVGQAVFVRDLEVDAKKVEIKNDPEEIVVKVEPIREEEEEELPVTEEAPVEGEAAESAQEEPKEGGEESKESKDSEDKGEEKAQ
jgi:large subunit ribosomal protein L25